VGKATTGEKASLITKNLNPDLILMDIFLGGDQDGFETALQIRKEREVPIIFISGNSDLYQKKSSTLNGINDFIAKPFSQNILSDTIENVMLQTEKETAL
jgi:DNA-binding response OmpR family regulator